jgi:hypothetical protein
MRSAKLIGYPHILALLNPLHLAPLSDFPLAREEEERPDPIYPSDVEVCSGPVGVPTESTVAVRAVSIRPVQLLSQPR